MKRYGFRLWFANLLLVVAALVLAVFLLGRLVPALSDTVNALQPVLIVVVSVCALAFAVVEAISIYRNWKASAKKSADASSFSER
ncbi:MAG: hypothetical protein GX417_11145 [Clostridiales bacterium]|nr:hypothetical protein [Clostridiales bacterium]